MVVSRSQLTDITGSMARAPGVTFHAHKQKVKQRFVVTKKLGQGAYGKVQLAVDKNSGKTVAVKTIRKDKIETKKDLLRIRREIQIMSSIRHPHIIRVYEVFENREKIVLVMEFAAGGELYEHIKNRSSLADSEARKVFRQIATACYHCHKHNICHRDLKLENILLDANGNAKIADFGLSNTYNPRQRLLTFCGSPLYASPEIVRGAPYIGPEVDCWSLGVLLYTLVYGVMPFAGGSFQALVRQISRAEYYRPTQPSPATELIDAMLTVDSKKRATIVDICSHWWINQGYNTSCVEAAERLAQRDPVHLESLLPLLWATPEYDDQRLQPESEDSKVISIPSSMRREPIGQEADSNSTVSRRTGELFNREQSHAIGKALIEGSISANSENICQNISQPHQDGFSVRNTDDKLCKTKKTEVHERLPSQQKKCPDDGRNKEVCQMKPNPPKLKYSRTKSSLTRKALDNPKAKEFLSSNERNPAHGKDSPNTEAMSSYSGDVHMMSSCFGDAHMMSSCSGGAHMMLSHSGGAHKKSSHSGDAHMIPSYAGDAHKMSFCSGDPNMMLSRSRVLQLMSSCPGDPQMISCCSSDQKERTKWEKSPSSRQHRSTRNAMKTQVTNNISVVFSNRRTTVIDGECMQDVQPTSIPVHPHPLSQCINLESNVQASCPSDNPLLNNLSRESKHLRCLPVRAEAIDERLTKSNDMGSTIDTGLIVRSRSYPETRKTAVTEPLYLFQSRAGRAGESTYHKTSTNKRHRNVRQNGTAAKAEKADRARLSAVQTADSHTKSETWSRRQRRNSHTFRMAVQWESMLNASLSKPVTLDRPKRKLRDSLLIQPKSPTIDEILKARNNTISSAWVKQARTLFERELKQEQANISPSCHRKGVILQDAGGLIPVKDHTGRVHLYSTNHEVEAHQNSVSKTGEHTKTGRKLKSKDTRTAAAFGEPSRLSDVSDINDARQHYKPSRTQLKLHRDVTSPLNIVIPTVPVVEYGDSPHRYHHSSSYCNPEDQAALALLIDDSASYSHDGTMKNIRDPRANKSASNYSHYSHPSQKQETPHLRKEGCQRSLQDNKSYREKIILNEHENVNDLPFSAEQAFPLYDRMLIYDNGGSRIYVHEHRKTTHDSDTRNMDNQQNTESNKQTEGKQQPDNPIGRLRSSEENAQTLPVIDADIDSREYGAFKYTRNDTSEDDKASYARDFISRFLERSKKKMTRQRSSTPSLRQCKFTRTKSQEISLPFDGRDVFAKEHTSYVDDVKVANQCYSILSKSAGSVDKQFDLDISDQNTVEKWKITGQPNTKLKLSENGYSVKQQDFDTSGSVSTAKQSNEVCKTVSADGSNATNSLTSNGIRCKTPPKPRTELSETKSASAKDGRAPCYDVLLHSNNMEPDESEPSEASSVCTEPRRYSADAKLREDSDDVNERIIRRSYMPRFNISRRMLRDTGVSRSLLYLHDEADTMRRRSSLQQGLAEAGSDRAGQDRGAQRPYGGSLPRRARSVTADPASPAGAVRRHHLPLRHTSTEDLAAARDSRESLWSPDGRSTKDAGGGSRSRRHTAYLPTSREAAVAAANSSATLSNSRTCRLGKISENVLRNLEQAAAAIQNARRRRYQSLYQHDEF